MSHCHFPLSLTGVEINKFLHPSNAAHCSIVRIFEGSTQVQQHSPSQVIKKTCHSAIMFNSYLSILGITIQYKHDFKETGLLQSPFLLLRSHLNVQGFQVKQRFYFSYLHFWTYTVQQFFTLSWCIRRFHAVMARVNCSKESLCSYILLQSCTSECIL